MAQEVGVLPDVVLSVVHQELLLMAQEVGVLPAVVLSVGHQELLSKLKRQESYLLLSSL
jgi:hypothetical protein